MRRGNVITQIRLDQIFFILDFIKSEKAMTTSQRRPIHIVNKNKQIHIWHCRIDHVSIAKIIRISKLVNVINIYNTEYNSEKVFIDFNISKIDELPNIVNKNLSYLANLILSSFLLKNTMLSDFDQLYALEIESKSTRTILQKSMTLITNKLEKIHIDL